MACMGLINSLIARLKKTVWLLGSISYKHWYAIVNVVWYTCFSEYFCLTHLLEI
jgi:hypothetical protein